MNFTEARCKALSAPPGRRLEVCDTEVTGLRLRVSAPAANGSVARSWALLQRIDGKVTRVTIGKWPKVSVNAARDRARVLQGAIITGANPARDKRRARIVQRTLREAFEAYLEVRRLRLKPRTVSCYRDDFKATFESIADRPLTTISRADVEKMHRDRSAVSPSRADGAMRLLSAIMNWAADDSLDNPDEPALIDNPVRRLGARKLWNNVDRRQGMIPLPLIGKWLEAAAEDQSLRMAHYLTFLLLTGMRRREADRLEWSAINLELGTVTLQGEDVKGGKTVTLPLPTQLRDMLKIRRAITPKKVPWVFASAAGDKHVADPRRALARIGKESGIRVTCHDLRRTYATAAETAVGVPPYTLKNLMTHSVKRGDVTGGYIVQDVEALRPWSQRVADHMFGQLDQGSTNVLRFARSDD